MVSKRLALLFLPFLQGTSADWTTTIKANLTVSNGLTPVIDFVTANPSSSWTLSSLSTTSASFNGKKSHLEPFTTTVTVRDDMVPVVHYRPIKTSQGVSSGYASHTRTASSTAQPAGRGSRPVSSQSASSTSHTSRSSGLQSSGTSTSGSSVGSSAPLGLSTWSTSASSGSSGPPRGGTTSSSSGGTLTTLVSPVGTTRTRSGTTSVSSGSSRPLPGGITNSLSTASNPTTATSQTTSGTTSASGLSSTSGSSSSRATSAQLTSLGLSDSPDILSLKATGSSSAEYAAILEFAPTGSPSPEAWGTLTDLPSSISTGAPAYTDAANIAVFAMGFYNNIDRLKKDPEDFKNELEILGQRSNNYLSKVNYDSDSSSCSGALKRRGLFDFVGSLASKAANVVEGATNVGESAVSTAQGIALDAMSCIGQISNSLIKTIPDDQSGLTDNVINNVKKGTEYMSDLADMITQMSKIEEDDDDDDHTRSDSQSSTSSSPSSATSTTSSGRSSTASSASSTVSSGSSSATSTTSPGRSSTTSSTPIRACKSPRRNTSWTSMTNVPFSISSSTSVGQSTTTPRRSSTTSPGRSSTASSTPIRACKSPRRSTSWTSVKASKSTTSGVSLTSVISGSKSSDPGSTTSSASRVSLTSVISGSKTSDPGSTTSSTSGSDSDPICLNAGEQPGGSPHCTCSTIIAAQTYWASVSLVSGECTHYTSFPVAVTTTPSPTPYTNPPITTPLVVTESNGEILSWASQTVEISSEHYTVSGMAYVMDTYSTVGAGEPSTLQSASPSQTSGNNHGSSDCSFNGDSCDKALEKYDNSTIYHKYTSYVASMSYSVWDDFSWGGHLGCAAMFECNNDDYGFGMTGRQLKEAWAYLSRHDNAGNCGTAYLSNGCHLTRNACYNCKATQ
ncbi:uncharacterized protein N7459_003834 [Penicillium hispanicum]|uniref:uncharacterized protein n=1 Tax=Penicillium hispanicum TaxID=1080232 RepID=UPI0025413D98|nr:uncharacterized protein N7459_003834 [Penicillium hispanicum]KAJ5584034.1 hypothetical protein N7459_003834 [Penicillium hispanicum]